MYPVKLLRSTRLASSIGRLRRPVSRQSSGLTPLNGEIALHAVVILVQGRVHSSILSSYKAVSHALPGEMPRWHPNPDEACLRQLFATAHVQRSTTRRQYGSPRDLQPRPSRAERRPLPTQAERIQTTTDSQRAVQVEDASSRPLHPRCYTKDVDGHRPNGRCRGCVRPQPAHGRADRERDIRITRRHEVSPGAQN